MPLFSELIWAHLSYVRIDYKIKDILILGKYPTQRLDDTTLTTEAQYSIIFSRSDRKFCISLIIMRATVFYLLMLQQDINSKQKILK